LSEVLEVSLYRNAAQSLSVQNTKIAIIAAQTIATKVTSLAVIGAVLARATECLLEHPHWTGLLASVLQIEEITFLA